MFKSIDLKRWLTISIGCLIPCGLYICSHYCNVRIDLTQDKRYTIQPATQRLLKKLQAPLQVDIYLTGELPANFQHLKQQLKALLEDFQAYTSYPLHYQFIDINSLAPKERKNTIKLLAANKIEPTNLSRQTQGQRIEKLIYPGVIIHYQDKQGGIMLLKANKMMNAMDMVQQSIENMEYHFVRALTPLVTSHKLKIGLVKGHEEPTGQQLRGLYQVLSDYYQVAEVMLTPAFELASYDALLITKPKAPFTTQEKYILDQYIMQGKKVLFFLDCLRIDMKNLSQGTAFALPLALNIDDLLFRYGVRINADLIQDLQAGVYPIVVGKIGNQPQIQFLPWPFFPIVNNFSSHLITKNLNALYTQFVSSIDTVQAPGVRQIPLLFTSPYSLKVSAPVQVDLAALRKEPDKERYQHGPIPIAYLLEGSFTSLYKNRLPPVDVDTSQLLTTSYPTKLLVAATGSLVLNAVSPSQEQALPWGYDPFLQQYFANPDFVLNALDYMLADQGAISAKRKTILLRPLNPLKVGRQRLMWQCINIGIPFIALLCLGIFWRKYNKKTYACH